MQAAKDQFDNIGATLIAITPQLSEFSNTLIDDKSLGFDLLADHGNEFAAKLGLRFALPDDLKAIYQKFGLDLPKHNGESSWTLPMPARIVVDTEGIVRSVDVDPDYKIRPEPEVTLEAVRALG